MKNLIVCVIFATLLFSPEHFSQERRSYMSTLGSLTEVKKNPFSSSEGGFSIGLPKQTGGFDGRKGVLYNWRLTEGFFNVGFFDRKQDFEGTELFENETLRLISEAFDNFQNDLFATTVVPTNIDRKEITFDGHKAIQTRIEMPKGLCIIRVFWIKNRAFQVGVMLFENQLKYEKTVLDVFDTLKIQSANDNEALIRQKVEEATPKPLPQIPVALKAQSDAQDENLKGKVKTVFQESFYIQGAKEGTPKQKDSEDYYNENGNLTKSVRYDDTSGQPYEIIVFGYINRSRVSLSGFIEYESQPPGMMISEPTSVTKRRNPRYDEKYAYKYNKENQLIQKTTYDNANQIRSRLVYKRGGKNVETVLFDERGRINNRYSIRYDDNGNDIESTNFDAPTKGWTSIYTTEYKEFDSNRNWTKCTVTKSQVFQGVKRNLWTMEEYRTIIYYQ